MICDYSSVGIILISHCVVIPKVGRYKTGTKEYLRYLRLLEPRIISLLLCGCTYIESVLLLYSLTSSLIVTGAIYTCEKNQ